MDRKEFLSAIGVSAAAFTIMNCMACSKGSDASSSGNSVTGPTGVDFTLDLTASANAALLTNGGYLSQNGVIVGRTTAGAYIAVQQSCTHESYPLVYQASASQFYCNNHGSAFTEAGVVKNSPANHNLTVYKTTLTNSSLRIYS
ncbi:Rieske 2Fe-2S domain-containing protein [Mucilaginibacter sp. BJC16-A38]|uniref:QcrA and Rieske domain-containing protein n=1 Tax=Mucilaginibacter phenanthrenivorans TaxID=1234842 RepID=UPI0021588FEF|nr:Rieske 2Fe-2S domain-containing protein [Mucilaginibacter phenanthrenivorans]MCR8560687.1 Rieske 2Fe-2S domain-containing protein [Mucilaginibacter phenanthrenivorans]